MMRLRLTPFEEYLVHEDQPAFPCWNVAKFFLDGALDRPAFEQAWRRTVARQPMLRASLTRGRGNRLYWEIHDNEAGAPVDWLGPAVLGAWPSWPELDLRETRNARIFVAEDGVRIELCVQIHHALMDGLGVIAVVEDLLRCYAQELGVETALPPLDATLLRRRGRSGLGGWEWIRRAPMQFAALAGAAQLMLARRAAPLIAHQPSPAEGPRVASYPALESRTVEADDFRLLRVAAKRAGVSVNELLMRDFQAAIGAWRPAQGASDRLDWIRLGVPVMLRHGEDRRLPACNVISMVIIDRSMKSCGNRPRLLRRAQEDMALIRRHKLGLVFLHLLALQRWLPGGIRAYCRRAKVRATVVMTNFGRAFHHSPVPDLQNRFAVPGAVLTGGIAAPVMRPGTVACLGVGLVAGRLSTDLHYDPRVLTAAQASSLADEFIRQTALSIRGE